jgi:hypothetical protein
MLVRDASGKINIISRSSCDSESAYNQQIYKLYNTYTKLYKSVFEYNLFDYNQSLNNNINNNNYKINNNSLDDDDEY